MNAYDDAPDNAVVSVEYWYFRAERAWVIQALNVGREQIGAAEYVYSGKPDTLTIAANMAARYGDVPVKRRRD